MASRIEINEFIAAVRQACTDRNFTLSDPRDRRGRGTSYEIRDDEGEWRGVIMVSMGHDFNDRNTQSMVARIFGPPEVWPTSLKEWAQKWRWGRHIRVAPERTERKTPEQETPAAGTETETGEMQPSSEGRQQNEPPADNAASGLADPASGFRAWAERFSPIASEVSGHRDWRERARAAEPEPPAEPKDEEAPPTARTAPPPPPAAPASPARMRHARDWAAAIARLLRLSR